MGWPGHIGQISFAALSQTVKTKSSLGASGLANSSQLLLRKFSVGMRAISNRFRASGRSARGMASRTVSGEARFAFEVENALGHYRPRRIPSAQKQDVLVLLHGFPSWTAAYPRRSRRVSFVVADFPLWMF